MRRRPVCLACTALVLWITSLETAAGQMHFWLSTAGTVTEGTTIGETPLVNIAEGGSGQLHIWAKPDTNQTLASFSLNLVSTSETAIEFTSAEVVNGGRFSSVFDTGHGLDISDQSICIFPAPLHGIWGLSGITVDPAMGTGLNAASPGADPNYDTSNGSWLLANIGYTAIALGDTDLYLEIGQIGMNYEGQAAETLSVRFGSLSDGTLSNAFEDRCERSATREALISVIAGMPGDFNLNGFLDAGDIDLLSAEVLAATNNAFYDLTGAATVDQVDRVYWVETLVGTFYGDADLNGKVEFADFLQLSGNFGNAAGWAGGDTDGNNFVDFTDFLSMSGNFGNGTVFAVRAVPEPSTQHLLAAGAFTLMGLYVRRASSSCPQLLRSAKDSTL